MKLVAGLGNPGKRYANTPHNAGFEVVAELGDRFDCRLKRSFRFSAKIGKGRLGDDGLLLVAPQTYMNNSGQAVGAILRYYKLDLSDLIVVIDDADLEIGRLRIRKKGRSGGHNGLQSIIDCVGGDGFERLRVGVGNGPRREGLKDYVLGRFSASDRKVMDDAIGNAADAVAYMIENGADSAMNEYNAARRSDDD